MAAGGLAGERRAEEVWLMADAATIEAGLAAEALQRALRPRLQRIRERILAGLIEHHRDETLTDGVMRSGIAMLAALASLEQELAHEQRLGIRDQLELQQRT